MDGLTSGNDAGTGASSAPGTGTPQASGTTSSGEVSSPQQASSGQGTATTQAATQSTAAGGQQAPQSQQLEAKKPNLFESPEFRNVQAQWQRQIAQERKEREQLAQQLRQVQRANLPEEELHQVELRDRDERINQLQSQIEQQQLMAQIVQDFQQLSGFSGIPVEELFDAYKSGKVNNLVEAQQLAMMRMKESFEKAAAQKAEQIVQKQQNNEVAVGGGAPMSGDDIRMQRLREFTKKKDSVGYFRELLRSDE